MSHGTRSTARPIRSVGFVRLLAPLAALGLGVAILACSTGATGPTGTTAGLREAGAVVGTWVYRDGDTTNVPMLGGIIVGDTIRLRADQTGRWQLTTLDPLDTSRQRISTITLRWSLLRDSLWLTPTCTPSELCDPIPGWVGTIGRDHQLALYPSYRALNPRLRMYVRLDE